MAACAVAVLRRQRGDGISAVRLSAGGKETNGMKKAISGVGDRLSLSKKEGTSKGLLPPFGEKSGKEEGKEERGVVPGAV